MATYIVFYPQEISWQRSLGGATVHGVGHNLVLKQQQTVNGKFFKCLFQLTWWICFSCSQMPISVQGLLNKYVLAPTIHKVLGKSLRIQLQVLTGNMK